MAIQSGSKSPSRRALLAGALSGIGVWAAGAIGRVSPMRAADGQTMLVGGEYTATSTTKLTSSSAPFVFQAATTAGNTALRGEAPAGIGVSGSSGSGVGVTAFSNAGTALNAISNGGDAVWAGCSGFGRAVYAQAWEDPAVVATSHFSTGVIGSSATGVGMYGYTESNQQGVLGWSAGNGTGMLGVSGIPVPAGKPRTGIFGYANQQSTSKGVWGSSPKGHGIHGQSDTGWAGYFDGRVLTKGYQELVEIATPAAPGRNHARLFIRDNGNGKTQLCVRFHTGAVRVLAVQP
jgi:hypothetical protein